MLQFWTSSSMAPAMTSTTHPGRFSEITGPSTRALSQDGGAHLGSEYCKGRGRICLAAHTESH